MASITKNKLTVVVVVAILAIMLLPSMIDSSSVTNSTTNATTNNTTIQSTTITTAITANTCSTNQFGYGINASGYLKCQNAFYSVNMNNANSCLLNATTDTYYFGGFDLRFLANSSTALITMLFNTFTTGALGSQLSYYLVVGNSTSPACNTNSATYYYISGGATITAVGSYDNDFATSFLAVNGLTINSRYWIDIRAYEISSQWDISYPTITISY